MCLAPMPLAFWARKLPKKNILAFIYMARGVAISMFCWLPLSRGKRLRFFRCHGRVVVVDRAADQRTVAQIFGVAHLSMLGGFVFFSHQIGSFMGVWLGGYLYDKTGSYDIVWYIAIDWEWRQR
jgi:predicted MFS family arabinose efflux permease